MQKSNIIYCLSLPIGPKSLNELDSTKNKEQISAIKFWITENAKTLRRYISSLKLGVRIDDLTIVEWNKHGEQTEIYSFLKETLQNHDLGLVSDAGMPGIADPGALAVAWAHANDYRVIPVVGVSSLFMALCASGLNGQSFKFNGYLPVGNQDLKKKLAAMVADVKRDNTAQLFIETPYRNKKLFDEILSQVLGSISLTIAFDIHGNDEFIKTKTLKEWKKNQPNWVKAPCVFILGNQLQR